VHSCENQIFLSSNLAHHVTYRSSAQPLSFNERVDLHHRLLSVTRHAGTQTGQTLVKIQRARGWAGDGAGFAESALVCILGSTLSGMKFDVCYSTVAEGLGIHMRATR
jgi:hypothetical protein